MFKILRLSITEKYLVACVFLQFKKVCVKKFVCKWWCICTSCITKSGKDKLWVPITNILHKLTLLKLTIASGYSYAISKNLYGGISQYSVIISQSYIFNKPIEFLD